MATASSGGGGNDSARDCVLYRYTGTTIDYILGIIDFETSVGGLYFEGVTNVGTKNYFIKENEKIINGFRIVADKNKWISSADPSTTTFESKEQTLILCIGHPYSKIYTTTGDITINIDFNIIHTTTVFIEFNNKQYIPNVNSIANYSFANASGGASTEISIDSLTREMTSLTMHRLLFFLNCVDISKIKALQRNSGVSPDTIAHFINLLMVEIKLDNDINLNSKFLTDLNNDQIMIDPSSIKSNPIYDLLMHLDSFSETMYNSYDIYSNAGLNFTKIVKLQKKGEYKKLIDEIIAKYRKQVDAFKTHIESIQGNPQFASIMVEMQNYVLKETARPKNVVIINVKTRVSKQGDINGVRNPMNLRYNVSTNIEGKILKIDAVDSSYPLYDGQNLRDLNTLVLNTGGEVTELNGKPAFNRKTKLVCGPFDDIVDPDKNNKKISQTPIFAEIKNKLRTDRYVCMFGKGISGSGKTSTLIYNLYGEGEDGQIGALFHLCKELRHDGNFNCGRIILQRSEMCVDPNVCDTDNQQYTFDWKRDEFYCTSPNTFETQHVNNNTKECTQKTCTITNKTIYEVAELLLTKTRLVRTTPLNPSSSRSHSALTMKLICTDKDKNPFDCFLTVVDAAGREKVVECGYGILVRLANAFADTEENKNKVGSNKERSYHDEGSKGPRITVSSKVREDVDDFTQVDKITLLLKTGSSQRVKDVLHVLGGCDEKNKINEIKDVIQDEKLSFLSNADRKKYLQEINPNAGSSIESKFVNELFKIIQKLKVAQKDKFWVAINGNQTITLPFDEDKNTETPPQYIKGIMITGNRQAQQTQTTGKTYFIGSTNEERPHREGRDGLWIQTLGAGAAKTSVLVKQGDGGSRSGFVILNGDGTPTTILVNSTEGTRYQKESVYIFKKYDIGINFDEFGMDVDKMHITEATEETYTKFYEQYDASIATQKTDFDKWKTGKLPTIDLFVTPNHKIHLGHVSEYRDDLTPAVTKFMTKFSTPQDKQQFYEDARTINTKLDTFFTVTDYISGECDKLSAQGRFINQELTNADSVINSICVRQNRGKPTMPPYGILNNNEYYEDVHVYNILKGASADEDIAKSVGRSQIIQSMFNMIMTLSGSQDKAAMYAEIADKISFFFFTIINLSPDTEMPNRVQYHHIKDLRKLLKKMKYESEFVEDYAGAKSKYNAEFNKYTKEITDYYTRQKLQNVTEILALTNNITKATAALANSTNYEQAIKIVETVVFEINSINGSTIIGSIANDGDTCVLQGDAGLDVNTMSWTPIVPTPIR
jgi:hypothetical protein